MAHRFELSGLVLPGEPGDELGAMAIGPWDLVKEPPSPESGLFSFSAEPPDSQGPENHLETRSPADDSLRWCIDIDGDPAEAVAALARGAASIADTENRLSQLPGRMDAVLGLAAEHGPDQVSFSASMDGSAGLAGGPEGIIGPELALAERDLLSKMLGLDRDALATGEQRDDTGLLSFDAGGDSSGEDGDEPLTGWRRMADQAGQAIESVLRKLLTFSWVETRIRGQLVAQTRIGWTGDSRSVVSSAPSQELAQLHVRSVSLAVRTRHAWGKLVATVVRISQLIIKAWANPASLITALPMAWRFAREALAEAPG